MLDWIIRGGLLVDGSGRPGVMADVAIAGDRIEYVGALPESAVAEHVVDATGHVVSPGFVDIHTHSDFSLLLNRRAESSVRQGVTTELVGNCGMGCAPTADPDHVPLVTLEYHEAGRSQVTWRTFGEWLDALETGGLSINVAALVGHGAVRLTAMGVTTQPANRQATERMAQLVAESMTDGAFGLSSGLEYNPGKNATVDELTALAAVAARHGGLYTTHIRNRDYHYAAAVAEAIETAAAAGASLQISHIAPRWGSRPGSMNEAMALVDQAERQGVDVWFDNHPYVFGRGLVMSALPPEAFEGGVLRLKQRLEDPLQRKAMYNNPNPQWKHWREGRWDLLTVYDAPHNQQMQGKSIAAIAETTGKDPWDVVCDLLLAEWENPAALYWSAPIHNQADVDFSFQHPRCLIMSDGSAVAPYGPYANVRHIYAYGWATHVLSQYVRERKVLKLEQAIHKMSGLPAQRLGLHDRGVIAPGYKADVVIFHPGEVQDRATFADPIAYPGGIRNVWVNGVLTVSDGEHTGALAGVTLRHGQ